MTHSYDVFALSRDGRVDRGFHLQFANEDEAIRFGSAIEGASIVEIQRAKIMIARILFGGAIPKVFKLA